MTTAAITGSTGVSAADTRNLQWKSNNVGSKLLNKLGWKDGEAIGKRKRRQQREQDEEGNADESKSFYSSEGLRIKKRKDGLGLGASAHPGATLGNGAWAVQEFGNVLQSLQAEGTTTASGKKKKTKHSKKLKATTTAEPTFATNKSTHAKVRQAKFQKRTADDFKAIFGGTVPTSAFVTAEAVDEEANVTEQPAAATVSDSSDGKDEDPIESAEEVSSKPLKTKKSEKSKKKKKKDGSKKSSKKSKDS